MKDHVMGGSREEGGSTRHQCKDAVFAILAECILLNPFQISDPAHQGFRLMGIEVITDNMPTRDVRISGDDRLGMRQENSFRARGSTKRSHKVARHDIAAENEAAGAVPLVLEFTSLDMAWSQRESRMFAFQSVNAR